MPGTLVLAVPKGLAESARSATLEGTGGPSAERRSAMADQIDGVDFALAAYREEGSCTVQELAHDVLEDIDSLSHALRRFPGDGGAVGLVAIDEDFFVIVRVAGPTTRVLLSDITAAARWAG